MDEKDTWKCTGLHPDGRMVFFEMKADSVTEALRIASNPPKGVNFPEECIGAEIVKLEKIFPVLH